jgi:polygalacturonase
MAGCPGLLTGRGIHRKMAEVKRNIICPVFPDKNFLITDFGAVAGDSSDSRHAILHAIDSCSFSGGGRVVIPPGKYFSKGPLILKSNVNLYVSEGAEIIFSPDENDYLPLVLTRWEGTEVYNYSPLIYAWQAVNIAITGKGTLNGQGSKNFAGWKEKQKEDQQALRTMGSAQIPVQERIFGRGHFLRPAFIEPVSCCNVLIGDIQIIDAPFWVIHPLYCRNVIVCGVRVESFNPNNDGCDPESCSDVLIENCCFKTGDDAIAIKSGRDADGRRIGRPSENIMIKNCTFDSKINGLCIGSEISGGVRNVFVENLLIKSATDAIFLKSNPDRGGYVKNIHINDVQVQLARSTLIKIEPDYKHESKSNFPTLFRDIQFKDLKADSVAGNCIDIKGFEKLPVQGISIRHIRILNSADQIILKNAKEIELRRISAGGKKVLDTR